MPTVSSESELMERKLKIAARIKQARLELHLSQEELGKLYGASGVTISEIERGISNIDIASLEQLARVLGKPLEWFLSDKVEVPFRPIEAIMAEAQEALKRTGIIELPVRGTVPCGRPFVEEEKVEGYIPMARSLLGAAANKNPYVLNVSGESLAGDGIHDGQQVVVEPNPEFVNGKIYIIRIEGECVAKHVYWSNGQVKMTSTNKEFPEMTADRDKVEILGRVILFGKWEKA